MIDINPYLKLMVNKQASDLFFTTDACVHVKVNGVMRPVGDKRLTSGATQYITEQLLDQEQMSRLNLDLEMNFAHEVPDIGRFRVNILWQRGELALVFRYIREHIPTVEALNLPGFLNSLVMKPNGLVLIVGSTGSGKSTTLASMIDHRNSTATGHILTLEDPIEFSHKHKRSIVNQREVGIDTHSYSSGLMNAMREAPDVIMIGEIRDRNTMEQAIRYSETGHLCLATLHSTSASQAVQHICNFFDDSELRKINMDLSINLQAIVAQRLVRDVDQHFTPVTEVLINTPHVSELIANGDHKDLREAMENSSDDESHTFDVSLYELFQAGRITRETALANAYSRNNLELKIRFGGAQ